MNESVISFTSEDGEIINFEVVEQTKLGGIDYILVTEAGSEDGDAYILKEKESAEGDSLYEIVEDDAEFNAVSALFAGILEDIDLITDKEE